MDGFVSVVSGVVSPAEFFSDESVGGIFAAAHSLWVDAPPSVLGGHVDWCIDT